MTDGEDVTPMAQDAKPRPGQSADGMLFMQSELGRLPPLT